ncbi:BnaA06g12920D [Brassica napus]|nr:BnaA06g12920D [Brassica napus]
MEFHRSLRPKFQSRIQLPLVMGGNNAMQEAHSMTWLPDNSNQQTILHGDFSFLPNRRSEMQQTWTKI